MRLALDTNRFTDLRRGDARVEEIASRADELALPLPVVAELRAGYANGARRAENERLLARFLATERVTVLLPDEQTTHFYADLYASLRRRGTPVPTNDLWIAALVIQYGFVLFDRDSDFDCIPELARIGPV